MGERESYEHGTFSWTDLSTPDAEASKAFYGGLFGWTFEDSPIPEGGVYVMAKLGGRSVGAMFESSERHPAWASYVTVDDADAIFARLLEHEVLVRNYSSNPTLRGCLRVTAGLPQETDAFLGAMEAILDD